MPSPPHQATLLVVEDDAALRAFYQAVLGFEYTLISVGDGLEALRYLETHRVDLLILDLRLPDVDGRDVQQELAARRDTRDIPILVITGDDPATVNRAVFACVLRKPVTAETLDAAVHACLRSAAAQRPARR